MSSRPTTGPGPIPLEQQIVEGGPVQGNGDGHENGGPRTVSLKASGTLIDRLRATRVWMLSIVLLAVGIAAVKMYLDPVQYSSSAVLLFAEQDPLAATSQARPSTDATQLYQLAASTEMFDHLIARFDLYDHYEVDTLRPLHYAETVSLLQRNMSVNLLDVNCLAITVRDAGRAMAAAMANEAFSKLQDITEQRSLAQMQRAVATYQQVIQHTEDRYREQSEHLLELVTEFKELSGPYADPRSPNDPMTKLDIKLGELSARLSVANEDLMNAMKKQEISLALSQKENLPDVFLVRRAMEDINTWEPWVVVRTLLLVGSLTLICCVIAVTLWFKHGHELKEYLTTPNV